MCGANHQPPVQELPTTHHQKKRGKKLSADSIMKVTCLMALQASGRFPLQIDESTDISGAAQLLANVRYVDADSKETFFFCKEMESHTTGEDGELHQIKAPEISPLLPAVRRDGSRPPKPDPPQRYVGCHGGKSQRWGLESHDLTRVRLESHIF